MSALTQLTENGPYSLMTSKNVSKEYRENDGSTVSAHIRVSRNDIVVQLLGVV